MRPTQGPEAQAVLLRGARAGDRRSFDGLVRLHIERVFSVLFRIVGSHEDAEDLAQEVFVRAYESLDRYRGQGSFEGWLTRIAVHLGLDFLRRRRRGPERSHEVDLAAQRGRETGGPEGASSRSELVKQLRLAIDRLPQSLRVALVLRVLEGLDYEEVARATGVKTGTVRTQVMKARRQLSRWLAPWLSEGEGGRDE